MAIESPLQAELRHVDPVAEAPFYIPGDADGHAPAPRAQARRYLHRHRQPRRYRRVDRRSGRAVPRRHALSLPSRTEAERGAAAAARLERARRQHAARGRSHQSRYSTPARRSCCRRTSSISRARSSSGAAPPISASRVRNHGDRPLALQLSLHFDSDFADLFEVRGDAAARGAARLRAASIAAGPGAAELHGLDDASRRTPLDLRSRAQRSSPRPRRPIASCSRRIESKPIFLAGHLQREPVVDRPAPFLRGLLAAHRELRATTARRGHGRDVERAVQRSAVPLGRRSRHADDRDAAGPLSVCRHPLVLDDIRPRRADHGDADAVVRSRHGARRAAPARGVPGQKRPIPPSDAEPGKILHEMRAGEMAALGEVPFGLYYGSVDSTPLFVLLAGPLCRAHRRRRDAARAVARDRSGARLDRSVRAIADRDGFVEYYRKTDKGSPTRAGRIRTMRSSMPTAARRQGPIALAEVQGYVFAAKQVAARCARRLGHAELARKLEARCRSGSPSGSRRRSGVRRSKPMRWRSTATKQPCRVRTSNAGQVLFTGIARPDRARLVADGLLSPRFFSGWGIRTVARGEVRYNPMSYHNGSIWPHDNALIALGFARYGLKRAVAPGHPGPVRGRDLHGPAAPAGTLLRVPARAPARTDALSGRLRAAGLGERDAVLADPGVARARIRARQTNEIRLRNPHLPPFLDEMILRNLQVGGSEHRSQGAPARRRGFARACCARAARSRSSVILSGRA